MSDALDKDELPSWWAMSTPMGQVGVNTTPEQKRKLGLQSLNTGADFTPVVGEIKSIKEGVEDFSKGNIGMGMLGLAGGLPLALGYGPRVAKGMFKSAGNVLNRTAENMPTHIENFYSGNPVAPYVSFGKEFSKAVPSAIAESTSATQRANKRVLGVSPTKMKDIVGDKGDGADLTAISIQRQLPNTQNTLLEKSPIALSYLDSRIPRENVAQLAKGIGSGFRAEGSVPDVVIQRATNHLTNGPHVTKPKQTYEYQIKDPAAASNLGYVESVAAAKTGAPITRALRGKVTDTYLSTINNIRKTQGEKALTQLSSKNMVEFMQVSSTLDKTAMTALKSKGVTGQDSEVVKRVLTARAKQAAGKPLKEKQEKLLTTFNELIDSGKIKFAKVSDEAGNSVGSRNLNDVKRPEGHLFTQQSFVSRQKELGGMNVFVAIDPETQKMYTMLSDGHDIFGQTPVGGTHLITTFPLIESSYKTGSKWSNKQIKTRNTKENSALAVKEVESVTGIPINKKETPLNYTKRAFSEAQIDPTSQDIRAANQSVNKLKVAGTAGAIGAGVGIGMLTGDDE